MEEDARRDGKNANNGLLWAEKNEKRGAGCDRTTERERERERRE